jgi:hypothetical protein
METEAWRVASVARRRARAHRENGHRTDNCTHFPPPETELSKAICTILLSDLHSGGRYESGERITWRYVAKKVELMAGAFVFVFLAAMILLPLGARYWAWLKR